jgi:hypothetical protein
VVKLTVVIGEESAMICGRQGLGQRRATIQAVALLSPAAACRYNALQWLVVAFSAKQKEQRTPPAANQRQHHLVYVYVSCQLRLLFNLSTVSFGSILANILSDLHTRR